MRTTAGAQAAVTADFCRLAGSRPQRCVLTPPRAAYPLSYCTRAPLGESITRRDGECLANLIAEQPNSTMSS